MVGSAANTLAYCAISLVPGSIFKVKIIHCYSHMRMGPLQVYRSVSFAYTKHHPAKMQNKGLTPPH